MEDQCIAAAQPQIKDQLDSETLLCTAIRHGDLKAIYKQLRFIIDNRCKEFLQGDYSYDLDEADDLIPISKWALCK